MHITSVILSERAQKKWFTNFAVPRSFLPGLQFSFFLLLENSQGHILTIETHRDTPETPRKSGFFNRKRPKEGERVAPGHFHERGDESPRKDENFGASGSAVSFFVSEIWPFKVDFSA